MSVGPVESYLLAYIFTSFVVGTACLGGGLVLSRLRQDELARAFLFLYVPLSALVLSALVLALELTRPFPSAPRLATLEYLEAFVGRYGVMLALPLFAHRVFSVRSRARDVAFVAVVLAAFGGQHLTEFLLGGPWDARGDVAEDLLFAGIVLYATALGFGRRGRKAAYGPLATRFLVLLFAAFPVIGHDVFLADGPGLRFYPLWYCVLGLAMVLTLMGRRTVEGEGVPAAWKLSPREEQVLILVQRGLSNREIARELTISPNTVKTHLRALFDKSGFRTRVALIAALAASDQRPGGTR